MTGRTAVSTRRAVAAAALAAVDRLKNLVHLSLDSWRNKLLRLLHGEASTSGERAWIHKALKFLGRDPDRIGQAVDIVLKVARWLIRKDLLYKGSGSAERPEDTIRRLANMLVIGLPVSGLADSITVEDGVAS